VRGAFDAGPSLWVVGVEDHPAARRQASLPIPPAYLAAVEVQLLDPGRPQHLPPPPPRPAPLARRGGDRFQQHQAVLADLDGLVDPGVLGLGQPPVVAALAVAADPLGREQAAQPGGCHHRQGLQRGPERLCDLLQPVQVAHRHTDVGGVGALAPAPLQQATLAQPIKHKRQ
jgi:hypothetical protein